MGEETDEKNSFSFSLGSESWQCIVTVHHHGSAHSAELISSSGLNTPFSVMYAETN